VVKILTTKENKVFHKGTQRISMQLEMIKKGLAEILTY